MLTCVRVLLFTATLALALSASATTVVRVSLQKMTLTSDLIVRGTVTRSEVVAVGGNERHLRTDVTIAIERVLKGDKARKILELQMPGGRLGKWAMDIPGMPRFTKGEEVVLFLEKTPKRWALTGLGQGKFTVRTVADGRRLVRRELGGVHFVGFDPKGRFVPVAQPQDKPQQTVEALLAEVRHILKVAREAPQKALQ